MAPAQDKTSMTNSDGLQTPTKRKIDWGYIALAALSFVGLFLATCTAWDAWKEPMQGIGPDLGWSLVGLVATIGGAIGMTFARHSQMKVVLGFAIIVGIFLQLNTMQKMQLSHHLTVVTPAFKTTATPPPAAPASKAVDTPPAGKVVEPTPTGKVIEAPATNTVVQPAAKSVP